ncbi:MAG TPA: twin-arginine translocase subunit TatC [Oculatellaceae cyanobacterium]|jgi:sec-independent protein translocase protein TatC
MSDSSQLPQFFERSGTDPGLSVPSSLPDATRQAAHTDELAMPLVDHIAELRNRVLWSVLALVIGIGVGFYFSLPVIRVLKAMAPDSIVFIQLQPGEVLMASIRVAFYMGLGLAAPVILYNLLRFVLPGLQGRERGMVTWAVLGGTLLFVAGTVFAYFFVVPTAISFLVDYGQQIAQTHLSIEHYISFCAGLLFVTGGMFELPMVLFLLSFTGLITSEKLLREWRWATILVFIASAVVTPTQDPFTMSIVAFAMLCLYALSIVPIKLCGR